MTKAELRNLALLLRSRVVEVFDAISPAYGEAASWSLNLSDAALPTVEQVKAVFLAYEALKKPPLALYDELRDLRNAETTTPLPALSLAVSWEAVTGKPTTFTPSEHTHEAQAVAWEAVTGKPTTFTPSEHTHEAQADSTPAGSMIMFGGAVAPTGWLFCDGAAVSRETYAALFAAIGVVWGAGDGSTTFNLPDARGRSAMGAGQGSGLTARTLGTTLGEEAHALTANENGTHDHYDVGDTGVPPTSGKRPMITAYNGSSATGTTPTTTSGLGTPHNTVHPVFVVNYIIKF